MTDLRKQIQQLVTNGMTDEAIRLLIEHPSYNDKNEIILLSNRLTAFRKKQRIGILAPQDEQLELSRINNDLLKIIDKNLSSSGSFQQEKASQKYLSKPKSNRAQIVLAICAVLTILITLVSFCKGLFYDDSIIESKQKEITTTIPIEEVKKAPRPTKEKIDTEKCITEVLTEEYLYSWRCVNMLIVEKKHFNEAIRILEDAKKRTANQKTLKAINSRLNDIDLIQRLKLDDAQGIHNDSFVLIKRGIKEGLARKNGEIIFNTIFTEINPYDFRPLIKFKDNGLIGFIDKKGVIIHQPKYTNAYPHDFYPLIYVEENGLSGFLDSLGNFVYEPQFESTKGHATDGMIAVKKNNKWGFIDTTGNLVINFIYSNVEYFDEGKAKVRLDDKEFTVDKKGVKIK